MKNIVKLMSVVLVCTTMSCSRNEVHSPELLYLKAGLTWEYASGGTPDEPMSIRHIYSTTLRSDTMIDGVKYLLLNPNIFLRDDATGMYAYFLRKQKEFLIHPYKLSKGDKVLLCNPDIERELNYLNWGTEELYLGKYDSRRYAKVTSIDTVVLENGEKRPCFHYDEDWYVPGFGFNGNIWCRNEVEFGHPTGVDAPILLCHYVSPNTALWFNRDCATWATYFPDVCLGTYTYLDESGIDDIVSRETISISRQGDDLLFQPKIACCSLTIYTLDGQLVYETSGINTNIVLVKGLTPQSYVYRIVDEQGGVYSDVFIQ